MLGAGLASIENDDVAELAVERTAPRELDAHRVVGVQFQQIEPWNGGCGDIGFVTFGAEASAGVTPLDGFDELRQSDFTFVQHFEISLGDFWCIGSGTGVGATHGHRQATPLRCSNLHLHVVLLDDHSGYHHQLSPIPLGLSDLTDIAIDQLHFPFLGKQCRHRDQPQGRQQNLAIHQLQDFFVAPEGFREEGIDEQGAHDPWR